MRLIGLTFFTLATYLAAESTHDLLTRARPGETAAGLAITAAALIVMPAPWRPPSGTPARPWATAPWSPNPPKPSSRSIYAVTWWAQLGSNQ